MVASAFRIHSSVGSRNAGHVVLADRHITDAVLCEDGEVALTIGTDVGVRDCQLFGTLLSSTVVAVVAQLNGVQAGLCALLVDQTEGILLIDLVLVADVGVFFFDGGGNRSLSLCSTCGHGLERCEAKDHSQSHRRCCDILNGTHFEFHKTSSGSFCI